MNNIIKLIEYEIRIMYYDNKGGDLGNFLFIQRRSPIAENCFLEWSLQIVAGLGHLHDHDILHRDLKPE